MSLLALLVVFGMADEQSQSDFERLLKNADHIVFVELDNEVRNSKEFSFRKRYPADVIRFHKGHVDDVKIDGAYAGGVYILLYFGKDTPVMLHSWRVDVNAGTIEFSRWEATSEKWGSVHLRIPASMLRPLRDDLRNRESKEGDTKSKTK